MPKVLGWLLQVAGWLLFAGGVWFGLKTLLYIIFEVYDGDFWGFIGWFFSPYDLFTWFGIPLAIIVGGGALIMGGRRLAHRGGVI